MSRQEAYLALTQGVDQLDFRGRPAPSALALIGEDAFPLAMNPRGQVLMAASAYGEGRLVVLGHEDLLAAFPAVVANALAWLNPASDSPVAVHPSCEAALPDLSRAGVPAGKGCFREGLGVYVTDAYSVEENAEDLVAFLKGGGGLLVAGQAWKWAKENPEKNTLMCFPGNKVCSVAGVYFTELEGELGVFPVPPRIPSSWLAVSIDHDFEDDMEFLLRGVSEFNITGGAIPSEVLVHGALAFPIATDAAERAFFAGAYYGRGRVVVTTHEGYLGNRNLAPFLLNAVRWLDGGREGEVGVLPQLSAAHALLAASGLTCAKTDFRDDLSVYVCTSYSDAHARGIQEFVAEGGGLLIGGHGWNWAQHNRGRNILTDYPGNRVLNKLGVSIMGNTLRPGTYPAPEPGHLGDEAYRFRGMLKRMAGHVTGGEELTPHEKGRLQRLGGDCSAFLCRRAHGCLSYASVADLLAAVVKAGGVPQVCPDCPVKEPIDHLLLNVSSELYKVTPDPEVLLPYIIKERPELPVVCDTAVKIDGQAAGGEEWKSTGLYLSPGMKTRVSVPPQIINKGWKVQIGCQTDNIGHASQLKRAQVVHDRFDVDSEAVEVSNLWGGLIYLVTPPSSEEGELEIVVQRAVPAPYYKSGETTVEDWVGRVRDAPAPWAEMEFENIIMTMHSTAVRGVDRPDRVAQFWDSIMRAVADLAATPPKFARKERYVADVQISYGWMHAGYPIMMHSGSALALVDPESARKNGIWGPIHELGHNQQRGGWDFPPHTTECTCNLWSIYVHETVLGIERAAAHGCLKPETRKGRREAFRKDPDLSKWSVWVALETYVQLQEAFGWDPFKKIFAAYQDMKGVPRDNHGKMNLFAETFSRTVNKNLAPFFKAWAWPILPSTEEKLADLPAWTDDPMSGPPS